MILVVDIGNSNIVLGIYDSKLENLYRIRTDKFKSPDEYALLLNKIVKNIEGIIISSVVPELNSVMRRYFFEHFGIEPIIVGPGVKTGLKLKTDNPKEVGADLVCSAVGAVNKYDNNCLIIDLGTASTLTYVEAKELKGVIITTGLATSKNALINNTSLLPQFVLEKPNKVLGRNTIDCLKSGLVYGHAAMIDGLIQRVKEEVNNPALKVIITGGLARTVAPLCKEDIIYDENLLLDGLKYIYDLNKENFKS